MRKSCARSDRRLVAIEAHGSLMFCRADSLQLMQIVRPGEQHLPSYIGALEQGWSADTVRGAIAAREELQEIAADRPRFLSLMDDREALGPRVTMPDGSPVPRLRWLSPLALGRRVLWIDRFSLAARNDCVTAALPGPHRLCGSSLEARQRVAKQALNQLLQQVRNEGLPFIEITTDPTNIASRRVIEANAASSSRSSSSRCNTAERRGCVIELLSND